MNSARDQVEITRLRSREVLQASNQLVKVQRRTYRVEAALTGDHRIPRLTESTEILSAAELNWHVALTGPAIIAAIAHNDAGPSLEVDRLFVEPSWHRLGLACRITLSLDSKPIHVSTGREYQPARRLYESLGFSHFGNTEALPGLWLSQYRRPR